MQFIWDEEKNKKNIKNHGIDFETAARVFADPYRIEKYDGKHSDDEDRYVTIGSINGTTYIVMVAFTERGNAIRMISARKATSRERRAYYDSNEEY